MFYGSETDGVRAHAERLAGGGAALEQMTTTSSTSRSQICLELGQDGATP